MSLRLHVRSGCREFGQGCHPASALKLSKHVVVFVQGACELVEADIDHVGDESVRHVYRVDDTAALDSKDIVLLKGVAYRHQITLHVWRLMLRAEPDPERTINFDGQLAQHANARGDHPEPVPRRIATLRLEYHLSMWSVAVDQEMLASYLHPEIHVLLQEIDGHPRIGLSRRIHEPVLDYDVPTQM